MRKIIEILIFFIIFIIIAFIGLTIYFLINTPKVSSIISQYQLSQITNEILDENQSNETNHDFRFVGDIYHNGDKISVDINFREVDYETIKYLVNYLNENI